MSTFKKCKVVMLPTNEKANFKIGDIGLHPKQGLTINKNPNLDSIIKAMPKAANYIKQHLYITSDDKIKEDDYTIYNNGYNSPGFVVKKVKTSDGIVFRRPNETWEDYGHKDGGITPLNKDVKKIIATTDTELGYGDNVGAFYQSPQPSQSFIEKYVEEYNKDNIITDVLVEYNSLIAHDSKGNKIEEFDLEVKSKDNTIIIKKVKDSWSRDEVIDLLTNHTINLRNKSNDLKYTNKWIEENL